MTARLNRAQYKQFLSTVDKRVQDMKANKRGKSANVNAIGEMIDNIQVILQLFKESAKQQGPLGRNGMKKSMPASFRRGLLRILDELVALEKKMKAVENAR